MELGWSWKLASAHKSNWAIRLKKFLNFKNPLCFSFQLCCVFVFFLTFYKHALLFIIVSSFLWVCLRYLGNIMWCLQFVMLAILKKIVWFVSHYQMSMWFNGKVSTIGCDWQSLQFTQQNFCLPSCGVWILQSSQQNPISLHFHHR